jgi:hypothetical protein
VCGLFKVKRKKLFFSIVAVIVCAVLLGGTVATLNFMSAADASSSPKTIVELQTPLPKDCITAQQAIQTAKNYTNQYAKENNRTITEIKAVFGNSLYTYYEDIAPSKSDNSTTDQFGRPLYYVWNVTALFQEIAPENTSVDGQSALECYTSGYLVSIWGYSGQLKSQGQIIIINQLNLYDNLQLTVRQGLYSVPKSYVSAEQAIQMATTLYINPYVSEKNRTVIIIDAILCMAPDLDCKRGNDSYAQYPIWDVTVYFDESAFTHAIVDWPVPVEFWTYGYEVGIWADTAQIRFNQENNAA